MRRRSKPEGKSQTPSWWTFTGDDEVFRAERPDQLSRLYFPLCNEAGLLSAITPRLQGDIKTSQDSFLTLPVSTEDLHNTRSGRNFWALVEGRGVWSAAGASADAQAARFRAQEPEKCTVEAGALWHRVLRENKRIGLRAEITNFAPAAGETLEIMVVKLTNIARKPLRLTPTAAIPIYGRSADNLRDHRHVTSLLHRIHLHPNGVLVQPTMSFDERGHRMNSQVYAVLGCEASGERPLGSFPTVASFIGEGGAFDAPRAVLDDLDVPELTPVQLQGREAMGALRYKTRKLAPSATATYLVFMGIAPTHEAADGYVRAYGTLEKTEQALDACKKFWKERLDALTVRTGDEDFNRWFRWVTLQPMLRKIFGNSFLPDFDYGRGGRGWRDLWQDSLALLLLGEQGSMEATNSLSRPATTASADARQSPSGGRIRGEGGGEGLNQGTPSPHSRQMSGESPAVWRPLSPPKGGEVNSVRTLLLNSFGGVRMRGTNSTIIGKQPGEFIADRNNISRIWMDHGVWPYLATELYIHHTGDWGILTAEAPYFWDQDHFRSPSPPPRGWRGSPTGGLLPLPRGEGARRAGEGLSNAPKGTVLEHLLVQHFTAYFNVGEHGNCRLEDADWNDGLDMARERGESVAFTSAYAGNLLSLSDMLQAGRERGVHKEVSIAEELEGLLESTAESASLTPKAKRARLAAYRSLALAGVSGRKIVLPLVTLIDDLRAKGQALAEQVRQKEWLDGKSGMGWFNGYYDNEGRRLEGEGEAGVRMTLTGQVFPILSGVATPEQTERCFLAAKKYLQDKKLGGFRLNTDFGARHGFSGGPPPLGRAFYFAYGEKENGSFFSHMAVMLAYGLYRRGFAAEGHEALSSVYRMCRNTEASKIYPGIPEYFNGEGRGLYSYLTGSASWFLLTYITQALGIRGRWGDLLLAPKLMPEQFGPSGQVIARARFAGKNLNVTYFNRGKKPYGKYRIESALVQGRSLPLPSPSPAETMIPRATISSISNPTIDITVSLS